MKIHAAEHILIDKFIDIYIDVLHDVIGGVENVKRFECNHTVSISLFNRGLAGKIFGDVKKTGAKVVMKNNTAECVLLSPDEYVRLMDEVNDARLLSMAVRRLDHFDPASLLSSDEVYKELGFSPDELSDADEVELE